MSRSHIYEEVTKPIQLHIAADELTREKYRVAFDVVISETGFSRSFSRVSQSSGTFSGLDAGKARLRMLIVDADFNSALGATAFAEKLLDNLKRNHQVDPPAEMEINKLLKKTVEAQAIRPNLRL